MPAVLKSSRMVTVCNGSAPEQTGWSCSHEAVRGGRELTGIVRKLSEWPADGDEFVSDGFTEKAAGEKQLEPTQLYNTHTHTQYIDVLISHSVSKSLFSPLISSGTKYIQQGKITHTQREKYILNPCKY